MHGELTESGSILYPEAPTAVRLDDTAHSNPAAKTRCALIRIATSPSDWQIIELSIEYRCKKLQAEADLSTRRAMANLLQEEEHKFTKSVGSLSIHTALPPPSSLASGMD
jgi:hypothetical protein